MLRASSCDAMEVHDISDVSDWSEWIQLLGDDFFDRYDDFNIFSQNSNLLLVSNDINY